MFYFLAFSLDHCYSKRMSDFISRVLQSFSITFSLLCLKKAWLKEKLQGHSLQARLGGRKFSVAMGLSKLGSVHQDVHGFPCTITDENR